MTFVKLGKGSIGVGLESEIWNASSVLFGLSLILGVFKVLIPVLFSCVF